MAEKRILTAESGAHIADNQNSQTAGPDGPIVIQDQHLLEKLARFNRERIPERIVHAVGIGAHGVLEVTNPGLARYTRAKLFQPGKKTEMFARFSTVAGSKGSADLARDPRGFALKFYTEDGNYDLVGNNTPIFFIRDPLKFPDFIHSQKYDPYTNEQEPENIWDFFSHSPEATHMFTWLMGPRGIPAGVQHMNGYGSHTFQWVNSAGDRVWVKYHFKTNQGIKTFTNEEAAVLSGQNLQWSQNHLRSAIDAGEFPSWSLKVQIMPEADAKTYRVNPFDVTKVWPHGDYPLIDVGQMTLNRNPANYFAEVEQSGFDPGHFVPGIGPSPDKMFQGRMFAYGDAHRYRLGINHTQLPINQPKAVVDNYGRDGFMQYEARYGGQKNYEPNSFGGPAQTNEPLYKGLDLGDVSGSYAWDQRETDDFAQAGALYRLMPAGDQARLVETIAGGLSKVRLPEIISRSIEHFRRADKEYGARIESRVAELKKA